MTRTMRQRGPGRSSVAGFTLLEMLTVVIIVGLLLAIGTPSVLHMQLIAMRKASLVTVGLIDGACDMYKSDLEEYPPSLQTQGGIQGRHNIVRALVGYGDYADDGKDGVGWKLSDKGQTYGPYNGAEKAKMKVLDGRPVFVDAFDYPILYYRWNGTQYVAGDNSDGPADLNNKYVRKFNTSGGFGGFSRKDFILCSKGPDGSWPNQVVDNFESEEAAYEQRDDITNFLD